MYALPSLFHKHPAWAQMAHCYSIICHIEWGTVGKLPPFVIVHYGKIAGIDQNPIIIDVM